jgi:pimeloyl-ACP methyl ester carboxylesterase
LPNSPGWPRQTYLDSVEQTSRPTSVTPSPTTPPLPDGILRQLAVERPHLVAHDFGGPFALAWAADHVDVVASITLINTPVRIDHLAAKLWRTPIVGELLNSVAGLGLARRFTHRLNPQLPDASLDRLVQHALVPGTKRAVLRLYRSTGRDAIAPYVERLSRFGAEALIVCGDNDSYIDTAQAEQQRRIFHNARIELMPGAGHFPWLEQPDRVADCVTQFLRMQMS